MAANYMIFIAKRLCLTNGTNQFFNAAGMLGLICFSTPYDITAADFLEQFTPEAFKIASFEIFEHKLDTPRCPFWQTDDYFNRHGKHR
jgi:hypothetical protein